MELIMQLIGSLGFPIVACIYLFKYMQSQAEVHKEELLLFKDAINNNTTAIKELTVRLETIERSCKNEEK